MKVAPVEDAEEKVPYTVLIQTGVSYPQLRTIKKWHDGTMVLTINPGSNTRESKLLKVKEFFATNTEGTVTVDYWLPKTIGVPQLLKVYLESSKHKGKKHALFVRQITILCDGKCYRFPIKNYLYLPKVPVSTCHCQPHSTSQIECAPYLFAREGAGTLRLQETEDFITLARLEELETLRSMVGWNKEPPQTDLLSPGHIDAVKYNDLPRFLQFRVARENQFLALTKVLKSGLRSFVLKDLLLQKISCNSKIQRFDSLQGYEKLMKQESRKNGWPKEATFRAMKVAEKFQDDEEFVRQMLCGPTAMLIRKVESLEGGWTDGIHKVSYQALEANFINDAMKQGRLFEVRYTDLLTGVPHGGVKSSKKLIGRKQTWYVTLADCLLYQNESGNLVPVLIRLENRNDAEDATFWTPPERKTSIDLEDPENLEDPKNLTWLLAKMYFKCADINVYSLCIHFARGHAINEVFAVAAYRNMSNAHPILRFLEPHIYGIIPINVHARKALILALSQFLSAGEKLKLVFNNYYKQFSYQDLLVPDDIKKRGVKEIPEYLYRDDMFAHWQLIKEYTGGMVHWAYPSDMDVSNDHELQTFIREVVDFGFHGFENGAGFPRSISDREKLTEYLTAIIVNISTFHTAVNFQTFTSYSFAPNAPSCMTKPPPRQDEEVTMGRILKSLPAPVIAFFAMNISFQLGQFSPAERFYLDDPAENRLGIIGDNMAVSPKQVDCIRRLTEGMRRLKDIIDGRNDGREIKYDVLSPVNTPITTQQ